MLITDLFVQGVDRYPQVKVRLPQGLSALTPVEDDTFVAVVRELLYSEGFDPQSRFATMPGDVVRVGGVIVADDGTSYRIIRDLKSGSAQLAKAEGGAYLPIANAGREVSQLLRTQLQVPARDVFDALFLIDVRAFPTPVVAAPQPVLMAQPLSLMLPGPVATRPVQQIHQEIQALKKQREAMAGTEQLEYELDGLQKKRFAFDELAEKRRNHTDRIASLEREIAQSAAIDELPANFATLAENAVKQKQKFDEDRTKLVEEIARMEGDGPPPKPPVLARDAKFLGGLGGGAVILLAAAFLDGDLRLIGLLDIAPFGLAAVQALGAVNDMEATDRYAARLKALKDRLKKVSEKYERDAAVVVNAVKRFNAESADEVVAAVTRRAALKQELERMKGVIAAFDAGEGTALQGDELRQLNARIAEVEAALLGSASGGGDTREIDRKIAALEAEMSGGAAPGVGGPPGAAAMPGARGAVAAAPAAASAVTFLPVVRALAEVSGADVTAVCQQLASRAAAYAGRLVSRPNTALSIDEQGAATFGGAGLGTLPGGEQHALTLAVRLAAYELAVQRHAFPLWVDRLVRVADLPHDGLPAFYAHLAKKSQVFLLGDETSGVEQRVALA